MPTSSAAQSALLKWANTIIPDSKAVSLDDLSDGIVLSKILEDIDPSFDPTAVPKPELLQTVVDDLTLYIQTKCDNVSHLLKAPGIKTVSENGRTSTTIELLTLLLMAAVTGPEREKYVVKITQLDEDAQAPIAKIIQDNIHEANNASTGDTGTGGNIISTSDDFELEFEVRYTALIAQKKNLDQEKDRLKKQVADLSTRLGRLQDNNEILQKRLTTAEDSLSSAVKDEDTVKVIKNLEARIQEQVDLITNQEGQLEQERGEKSRMGKQISQLTANNDLFIKLQDDLKEAKYQNVELAKKANTVDRYKQKLESQQNFQADNVALGQEIEELKKALREYDHLAQRNASLEATHRQFQDTLGKREEEIFELSSQRKLLDGENTKLQRRMAIMEDQKAVDDSTIVDLQEQISTRQSTISPTGQQFSSLGDELEQTNIASRVNLENSRLKAENQLLKGNFAAAQENNVLRIKLEEAERTQKALEAKYQDVFEKRVVAEQQITAMIETATSGGSVKLVNAALEIGSLVLLTPGYYSDEAFINLRKSHQAITEQLTIVEKKSFDIEAELESTKRKLLEAQSDLSMIEREDMDALEELKATQESLAFSFENELKALQSRHQALQIDHDIQKSQLIEALLSKDKLQDTVQNVQKTGASKTSDMEPTTDLSAAQQQIVQQDKIVNELHARIKSLEACTGDERKATLEQENKNLKREYDMMSTAWYDMAIRLQSNNVVLQRRAEPSKSWINKQRHAINPSGRR